MKYASIGSISCGTLRTEDLLSTFASELDTLVKQNYDSLDPPTLFKYAALIGAAEVMTEDHESADDILIELQDALETFALSYCYFGTNAGDGADFGFWPSMESVNELPRVENGDEAKALGEDCVFVNDHGNVTVFGGDGSVIWDCV
jgi:hypothetical protein